MTRPHGKQIREASRLMSEAKRPVLYVGGGVVRARASEQLRSLVDLTGIPVVTTLMARGTVPDSHDLKANVALLVVAAFVVVTTTR